ncbi:MAG: hypothetical protein QM652_13265 [Legionella sp.]|uniref:hypothetical protein n=1 Tax=Legionella sp. TaxID=459 RepID=UPI0039E33C9F
MGCIVELNKGIRLDFTQNRYKQKAWIEVLLKYSKTNIEHLASILDLSAETLIRVHRGTHYLKKEEAERLGRLFLIMFYD